jgi:hypothetical protein
LLAASFGDLRGRMTTITLHDILHTDMINCD